MVLGPLYTFSNMKEQCILGLENVNVLKEITFGFMPLCEPNNYK